MNLHKVTKIAAVIVAILSVLFLGGLMATSDSEDNSWINPLIYLAYVILAACVAVVLLFVFKNLFSNKENFSILDNTVLETPIKASTFTASLGIIDFKIRHKLHCFRQTNPFFNIFELEHKK